MAQPAPILQRPTPMSGIFDQRLFSIGDTPVTIASLVVAILLVVGSFLLGRLSQRLRLSNELYDAVVPALPLGLAAQVSAGPVDDEGWSLLCSNAAVAAKLRQLVPNLQQRLRDSGRPVAAIRVKVQPR